MSGTHADDAAEKLRFDFGSNWLRYLEVLDDERIREAEQSLKQMLGVNLSEKSFLDIGSGSGLFSLVARRLGASVHSFDYDPKCVACTKEIKRRFFPDDRRWVVQAGSVLDSSYLSALGRFDVVYSWGVLHHTGAMWQALENVIPLVAPGGRLFVAIYNDQGFKSQYWLRIKKLYAKYHLLRWPLLLLHLPYPFLPSFLIRLVSGRLKAKRGMSFWRDVKDWIGGYPYEVAKADEIILFLRERGFRLDKLVPTQRSGCNEFVFVNESSA